MNIFVGFRALLSIGLMTIIWREGYFDRNVDVIKNYANIRYVMPHILRNLAAIHFDCIGHVADVNCISYRL